MSTEHTRIIVGYDGSPDAERALRWAVRTAPLLSAPLHLVTARAAEPEPVRLGGGRPAWERAADDLLATGRQRASEAGLKVTGEKVPLPPSRALLDAAVTARLLVVGARGHTRLSGMLLGSVSQHVTRHAACTVVVVRAAASPDADNLVLGVDGAPDGEPALALGFELADHLGSDVLALHGCGDHGAGSRGPLPTGVGLAEELGSGVRLLESALAPWRAKHPAVRVTAQAVHGHPARLLADASRRAGLVIVGSRGRGAFAGLLLGSVSQAVLQHANCPVAVAR
jgi:nucleotide-binding universal stress UspA family protein